MRRYNIKIVLFSYMFFLCGMFSFAQVDLNYKSKPLKNGLLDSKTNDMFSTKKSDFIMFKSKARLPLEKKKKSIGFDGSSELKSNKELFEGKFDEKNRFDLTPFKRNQYLGDITTKSKRVQIICRDYQFVDGDVIRLKVNDEVKVRSIYLTGQYKVLEIDLVEGFNKIDFEAINMGSSPPNTAELIINDDKGNLLASHQWAIATGFKASFIVVKDID